MKELAARDLALMCHYMKLPLASLPVPPVPPQSASLSALAANFVASIDAQHPSAGTTILRTACKLEVRCTSTQLPYMLPTLPMHRIRNMLFAFSTVHAAAGRKKVDRQFNASATIEACCLMEPDTVSCAATLW